MMVVRMSPVCGWNMAPRIIKPSRNIESTASSSVPRPVRFSRKCPPPGISQPSSTAGAHLLTGGVASAAALVGVVGIVSSLAISNRAATVRESVLSRRLNLPRPFLLFLIRYDPRQRNVAPRLLPAASLQPGAHRARPHLCVHFDAGHGTPASRIAQLHRQDDAEGRERKPV